MLFSILSLVAGIIVVQQLPVLPENYWIVVLLILATCFTLFRLWRLMFFTIGLLWACYFASFRLADSLADHLEGEHLQIQGQVVGLPRYDDRKISFDFIITKSDDPMPAKIRLSWYSTERKIKAGQVWQMTVKLKKPHARLNPGSFDYERWLFIQNIAATGYVRNTPSAELLSTASPWQSFSAIRQTIAEKITFMLAGRSSTGLIKALTLGDKHEVNEKQWEVFRKTGSIHLLAISGLHIGLIAGLAYFLMLKIAIMLSVVSPQKIAALSAVLVAVFYSALAGFSLPTQRALIMLIIAMMAITLQRNTSIINTLALAMFAVLIIDPLAVLSAGFWLSFLAVTVIAYSMAGRLGKTGYWLAATKVHCVTALGLSPLLLFYFQQVSLIAPLANFIAVPVISLLVVPLCFLAVLLILVSDSLAQPVFLLIDQIIQWLLTVLSAMADFPFAAVTTTSKPFYLVPLAVLGLFILLAPRGIPARWLGGAMLLPLLFIKPEKLNSGDSRITLLDVGQGLSAVIETTNHSLVFDTGAKYSEKYNMGRSVVIPYLKYRGIQKIDVLLISHADNDHIGGAESVIQLSTVDNIMTSVPGALEKYQPMACQRGQSWIWDEVIFEMLSPEPASLNGENNNSCVLKVTAKQKSILLTGDIEEGAESWLLENETDKLPSDILIAPHHGSKTSSSQGFLQQVKASMVLIPAGYRNRFSFPHQQVIERYKKLDMAWMNTADKGAITVELKNKQLNISSMREENSYYWNIK